MSNTPEFLHTFTRMEYALKESGDFAHGDVNGLQARICRVPLLLKVPIPREVS